MLASRAEFFDREKKTWAALTAAWRGLPEPVLLEPGACGPPWSVKDVMNHIAAWQEVGLKVIGDLQAGRWGTLGASTSKFNARQYEADRDRPLAETRRRLSQSHRALITLLETVPEKALLYEFGRQAIGWWAKYSTYGHYQEHLAALAAFREANDPRKPG
jgi:hypothetical protein